MKTNNELPSQSKNLELAPYDIYLALFLIAAVIIAIALIVRSSDEYSIEKTQKNSEEFAGEIRDSEGPVTKWLYGPFTLF
jgi:hypothetical protein